jgi:hypothetical protein
MEIENMKSLQVISLASTKEQGITSDAVLVYDCLSTGVNKNFKEKEISESKWFYWEQF